MPLSHEDYLTTKAWMDGIKRAAEQLALQPPDDSTTTVSLDHDENGAHDLYDHVHFKLCKLCRWDRNSDKCQCVEKGLI